MRKEQVTRSVLYGSGFVPTAAVALTLTLLLPFFYGDWNPGGHSGYTSLPSIFLIIEPLVVVAAWVGVWAWFQRRWTLCGFCLLTTVFGPWGINVELAVVPLGLGLVVLVVTLTKFLVTKAWSR